MPPFLHLKIGYLESPCVAVLRHTFAVTVLLTAWAPLRLTDAARQAGSGRAPHGPVCGRTASSGSETCVPPCASGVLRPPG